MSRPRSFDDLVTEAKEHLRPTETDVNWSRVDDALFTRIERPSSAPMRRSGPRVVYWASAASVVLASAAAVALFVSRNDPSVTSHVASTSGGPLVSVVAQEGEGAMLASGLGFESGATIGVGQPLEMRGHVRGYFEQSNSAKFVLEPSTRATFSALSPLAISLEQGAVEAEVVHTDSGEVFVVDMGATRVAARGTHLRVARDNERISVDLSEGTVAIGDRPTNGSTSADVVHAPAHIEFTLGRVKETMRIDTKSVRPRAAVEPVLSVAAGHTAMASPQLEEPMRLEEAPRPRMVPAPFVPSTPPPAQAPSAVIEPAPAVVAPPADAHPDDTIRSAVVACIAKHALSQGDNLKFVVTSSLELRVGDNGMVQIARFSPPLAPEAQSCATPTIYKVRFAKPGNVTIPIEFKK